MSDTTNVRKRFDRDKIFSAFKDYRAVGNRGKPVALSRLVMEVMPFVRYLVNHDYRYYDPADREDLFSAGITEFVLLVRRGSSKARATNPSAFVSYIEQFIVGAMERERSKITRIEVHEELSEGIHCAVRGGQEQVDRELDRQYRTRDIRARAADRVALQGQGREACLYVLDSIVGGEWSPLHGLQTIYGLSPRGAARIAAYCRILWRIAERENLRSEGVGGRPISMVTKDGVRIDGANLLMLLNDKIGVLPLLHECIGTERFADFLFRFGGMSLTSREGAVFPIPRFEELQQAYRDILIFAALTKEDNPEVRKALSEQYGLTPQRLGMIYRDVAAVLGGVIDLDGLEFDLDGLEFDARSA